MSSYASNLQNYFRKMCFLSALCGLTFVKFRSRILKQICLLTSTLIFILSLYLVLSGLVILYTTNSIFLELQNLVLCLGIHGFLLSPIVNVFQFVRMRYKFIEIMNKLIHICRKNCIFSDQAYKRYSRFLLLGHLVLSSHLLITFTSMKLMQRFKKESETPFKVTLLKFWYCTVNFQFFFWNLLLLYLFSKFKDSLLRLFFSPPMTASNPISHVTFVRQGKRKLLRDLKTLFWVKNHIYQIYGPMLIIYLWCETTSIVYTTFEIVHQPSLLILYLRMSFILIGLFSTFCICENVSTMVKSYTIELLSTYVRSPQYFILDEEVRNFCITFRNTNDAYRICNLINLNYKTLVSLISIAVAYIVVEFQLNKKV